MFTAASLELYEPAMVNVILEVEFGGISLEYDKDPELPIPV